MFMNTSQDFEPPHDGVVKWVASQSPNPALQALMKEAERDKKTRPSTPVHEPMSWTYPLTSTTSSASLSTSIASSGHNSADVSYTLPLSGGSSTSLAPRASDPSGSRRAKPLSAAQRKPLASSTSSANQPLRDSASPRSSSHLTALSDPSISKEKYIPREEGPEAMAFVELLKDVSRQLDDNSKKKQRLVVRAKEKERERSLGRSGIDNRMDLDIHYSSPRSLTKTSSASAIVGSTTRVLERTSSTSMSYFKPDPRGRAMAKTASLSAPAVDLVSGKSTPHSLPSPNLNCDLKLAPALRPLPRPSNISNANHSTAPEPTPDDGDSTMEDVIDLTDTDTEWERPISGSMTRADTTVYMQVDDEDSDGGMDVSFFQAEPPPQPRVAPPKPKSQPPQPRPPAPMQRTRTVPPLLGMRRAPQLQPSQHSASQASRGLSVPPFKPPLLAHARGTTSKNGSGARPATTTNSRQAPRGGAAKVDVAKAEARKSQDADSSFDVSFGVDAEALEEAMKAYD